MIFFSMLASLVSGLVLALTVSTFTGIQAKAKDTERQTDIKAIHGQVEAYYARYGNYPTLANMNDAAWRSKNVKELDQEALRDPAGTGYTLAVHPGRGVYSYDVKGSNGKDCNNTTVECAEYTLSATQDDGTVYSKQNLN